MFNLILSLLICPDTVQEFECLDWQDIVTPVKADVLTHLLKESGYDPGKIDHLHRGFTQGFDLGYCGPYDRQDTVNNLPFKIGSPLDMWNKIMK